MAFSVFTRPRFAFILLLAYTAVLIKAMVFKDIPALHIGLVTLDFSGTNGGHPANFVPLKTIVPYLLGENGLAIAGLNLLGNIIFLIPIGFLIPFVAQRWKWKQMLEVATVAGLGIETMQAALDVGIFDIDDVLLNGGGTMVGYMTFLILRRWMCSQQYARIAASLILVLMTSAAVIYMAYPKGHQPTPSVTTANQQPDTAHTSNSSVRPGSDLCEGSGGTGQIVTVGNRLITIRRNDGVIQTFTLTDRTEIRTAAGMASEGELKAGDRVTLVVLDSDRASNVLVCRS